MSQTDLLRLLELAHPGRPQADLLAMIDATPNAKNLPDRKTLGASGKLQDGKRHAGVTLPSRKPQCPPQRALAIKRRRRLASSGPLPPSIACCFTVGQQAVLRIVGDELRDKGSCTLPLAAIAARAGVCRKLAQTTIRLARQEGLLAYQERRRPGQVSQTNVLTIASAEWKAWLVRGPRSERVGGKKFAPTDTKIQTRSESRLVTNAQKGFRRTEGEAGTPARADNRGRPQWTQSRTIRTGCSSI